MADDGETVRVIVAGVRVRAARKLTRALKALEVAALDTDSARTLRRSLTRAARGIAQAIAAIDATLPTEPARSKGRSEEPPALRVAVAAASGTPRAMPGSWDEIAPPERFRRSS